VSLPHRTRLSTKIVRAGHLVDSSQPFPVRDVFANPRELISGVRDLPAVLPLVSRTRISQSWNVDQCVLLGKDLMLPRTGAYLPVLMVRNPGLPAVAFRSVLRRNGGKAANVFLTAPMEKWKLVANVSKNSRHWRLHVLLDGRSSPQIMDVFASPMLVLIRLNDAMALLPLALALLIASCAMTVLIPNVVSNATILSFLTLPKTIVFKFTSEWSLLEVTVCQWEFEERGELSRMKEVVESLGVKSNNYAQQCYDFVFRNSLVHF